MTLQLPNLRTMNSDALDSRRHAARAGNSDGTEMAAVAGESGEAEVAWETADSCAAAAAGGTSESGAAHGTEAALRALIKHELRSIQPAKLPPDWSDDARYREDLDLDSLDLVEMIARLEQVTGVYVPDPDVPTLTSVAATAAYMHARCPTAGSAAERGAPEGTG